MIGPISGPFTRIAVVKLLRAFLDRPGGSCSGRELNSPAYMLGMRGGMELHFCVGPGVAAAIASVVETAAIEDGDREDRKARRASFRSQSLLTARTGRLMSVCICR